MTNICQACAAPTDTFLCSKCVSSLRTALKELPQWLRWLGESAIGQTRMGDTGTRGTTRREPFTGDDQALTRCRCGHLEHENVACRIVDPDTLQRCTCDDYEPVTNQAKIRAQFLTAGGINPRAADQLTHIRNNLRNWVRDIGQTHGIIFVRPTFIGPLPPQHIRQAATTPALTAFLTANTQTIANDESAGQILRDILSHIHTIEKIVNRPNPKMWLTCLAWNDTTRQECGNDIYCPTDTIEVTCKTCRTVWNVNRLQLRMEQEAERKKLTISDILKMNRRLPEDRRINERTLRRWRKPGPKGEPPKLKAFGYRRPDGSFVINRHGPEDEELYRWCDIKRLRGEQNSPLTKVNA